MIPNSDFINCCTVDCKLAISENFSSTPPTIVGGSIRISNSKEIKASFSNRIHSVKNRFLSFSIFGIRNAKFFLRLFRFEYSILASKSPNKSHNNDDISHKSK